MDREAAIILDKAQGPQDQLAGREAGVAFTSGGSRN